MNMYRYYFRPVIYLSICAGAILLVFITIHLGSGSSSASGLEQTEIQSRGDITTGYNEPDETFMSDTSTILSEDTASETQETQSEPTQPTATESGTMAEEPTQPAIAPGTEERPEAPDTTSQTQDNGVTQPVQTTTERRAGILAPKIPKSPYAVEDEIIVNGKVHTPNYIPPEVDIDNLELHSLYTMDMTRRYIEGTISEREKDALVKISEKHGGIRIDHPTLGYIEIGEQIKAERNPGYKPKDAVKDIETLMDSYWNKLYKKTITPEELADYKRLAEQEGMFVNLLHGYFLDDYVRELLKQTEGYIDIKIMNQYEIDYISLEDYDRLVAAYNKMCEERAALQNVNPTATSEPIPIKWDWTEEEKVIEDENSPYLQYLIVLYYGGALTEDEEKLLNEALELFGWVLNPMTTEG